MLADDNIVALNDVAQQARQLVGLYHDEKPKLEQGHQAMADAHAADHQRLAGAVENAITALGELPHDSDPEAEGLVKLGVELRSLFSFNGEAALADSLGKAELALDEAISEAMKTAIPIALARDLAAYRETIKQHCQSLKALSAE